MWIVHDPYDHDTDHETEAAAIAHAQKLFKHYADHASNEGWDEEIENLFISKVTHQVEQLWVKHMPDDSELDENRCDEEGTYWGHGFESVCDYELRPVAPPEGQG